MEKDQRPDRRDFKSRRVDFEIVLRSNSHSGEQVPKRDRQDSLRSRQCSVTVPNWCGKGLREGDTN